MANYEPHFTGDIMRRYFVRVGDKTTAGGTVTQGEESFEYRGKAVAYEGAEIYCHTCTSTGRIANTPPYRTMLIKGKQIALDNDICLCKCTPHPRLIASQNTGSMTFDRHESAQAGFHAGANPLLASSGSVCFDDQFKLLDDVTGLPLANIEYAVLHANGTIEHGATDRSGHTHLLSSTAESETVHIYI